MATIEYGVLFKDRKFELEEREDGTTNISVCGYSCRGLLTQISDEELKLIQQSIDRYLWHKSHR